MCIIPALHVHHTCTTCASYLHYMCIIPTLHVHHTCTTCASYLHYMCIIPTLHVHHTCTTCASYLHYMCLIKHDCMYKKSHLTAPSCNSLSVNLMLEDLGQSTDPLPHLSMLILFEYSLLYSLNLPTAPSLGWTSQLLPPSAGPVNCSLPLMDQSTALALCWTSQLLPPSDGPVNCSLPLIDQSTAPSL